MLPAMMRLSRKEVAEGQGQGKRQDQGQEVEEAAAAAAAAKHGLWEKLVCVVKGQGRHWRAVVVQLGLLVRHCVCRGGGGG